LEPVLCARFLKKIQSQHISKNTLRKGKKHNVTVVFMVPKTFTKLSVQNKAELILYGRLKKEQFLGIQQKRHNQTGRSRFLAHKYLLGINVPQAIKIKVLVEAVWI